MTTKRRDNNSTEFGLWLREQREIDSAWGYEATNIDYAWRHRSMGHWQWLIIEEKRHGAQPKPWQRRVFEMLDSIARVDPTYHGFFLIVFENTTPDDGRMWINGKESNRDDLLAILKFEKE